MVRTRTEPEHYVRVYLVLVLPGLNMNMMFMFRFGSKCAEHEPDRTVASLGPEQDNPNCWCWVLGKLSLIRLVDGYQGTAL